MTEDQARKTANVILAAAALGVAVLIVRSPKWRRLAWQLTRRYAGGPLAVSAAMMAREAWDRSAAVK